MVNFELSQHETQTIVESLSVANTRLEDILSTIPDTIRDAGGVNMDPQYREDLIAVLVCKQGLIKDLISDNNNLIEKFKKKAFISNWRSKLVELFKFKDQTV